MQQRTLSLFDRAQDAETQTTRARARTAKQFEEFMKPDNLRLFPNLRWVGTTSVNPRQSHAKFAGKVWAKTDNFWKLHSPGTEWNCKCDIEETSDPVTDNSKLKIPQTPPALEGNPFETGEIFSEKASYISRYSNTQKRKVEVWAKEKVLRKYTIAAMKKQQGKTVTIHKRGESIEVLFDSKTTLHIANDVVQSNEYLWKEVSENLIEKLQKSKLVAHEGNTKKDKKPSAVEYFYYEYKTDYYTFYLSVEENYIEKEKRHFYRLYSITKKLRESAIPY